MIPPDKLIPIMAGIAAAMLWLEWRLGGWAFIIVAFILMVSSSLICYSCYRPYTFLLAVVYVIMLAVCVNLIRKRALSGSGDGK